MTEYIEALRTEIEDLRKEREDALNVAAKYKAALYGHVEYPSTGSAWEKAAEYQLERDKIQSKLSESQAELDAALKASQIFESDLCSTTAKLVVDFARALASKLSAAEKKYGYTDGWAKASDKWPYPECHGELMSHLRKGDPRDVAIYCAFLWFHKLGTEPCFEGEWHELAELHLKLAESQAREAVMRSALEKLADGEADQDTTAFHVHKLLTSTDSGSSFLAQFREMRTLLHKSSEVLNEVAAYGDCDCDIPSGKTCIPCECALHIKEVERVLEASKGLV